MNMNKYLVYVAGSNLAGIMKFTVDAASEAEAAEKVIGVHKGKIDPKDIGLKEDEVFGLRLVLGCFIDKVTEVREKATV